MEQLDLSDDQKRWLGSDREAWERFEDQALDLFDFGYGFMEFGHSRAVPERAEELIYRSHMHLEAAAATATNAYDFRGTVQSALIGAELALKAGLACHGATDTQLRRSYGHNLARLLELWAISNVTLTLTVWLGRYRVFLISLRADTRVHSRAGLRRVIF